MKIVDLRQMTSRQLEPLFEEEQRNWLEELHWDYAPSQQLIRKFVDARSLLGFAALENGALSGYSFYVLEERKGLIGGLFATSGAARFAICRALLAETCAALRAVPRLERIEAQLMPFGIALDPALTEMRFQLYGRQFMLLPLAEAPAERPAARGAPPLDTWDDRYLSPCARLIQLAYANHVDSEVNDQYHSEAGALKFLKNIIILPGCGQFLPEASFVVRGVSSDRLVGVVLNSAVAPGVAHTTQICVMPGYQGNGLGRHLMQASIEALRARRFHTLSLTVTSLNARAIRLYEKIGFKTAKTFSAAVWKA
jgi:ribosomal protein S18 acetylase RimI-like enzyme